MHSPEFDELCVLASAGELPEERRAEFERHGEDCADCRELLAALAAGSRAAERSAVSLTDAAVERISLRALGAEELPTSVTAPARAAGLRAAGLAAAALGIAALFVVREPVPAAKELAWTNGVEKRIESLSDDLARLDGSLTEPGWLIEEDLRRLEDSAVDMDRPFL